MIQDYLMRNAVSSLRPFFILDKQDCVSTENMTENGVARVLSQTPDFFSEDNIDIALHLTQAVKPTHLNLRNYVNFDPNNCEFYPDPDPILVQEALDR
jgi:hypothetical protein